MKPGIDNKPFEIVLNGNYFQKGDITMFLGSFQYEVLDNPVKNHWIYDILYYLSLGLYDRRGWKHKVKVIK